MKQLTNLAKTDKGFDATWGLFTPLQVGVKRQPVSTTITSSGITTEFHAVEALCSIDLRTLQTICSLAYAAHKSSGGQLVTSMYQLLKQAGLHPSSRASLEATKKSLRRLANTNWFYQSAPALEGTADECYGGGSLLQFSFENTATQSGELTVNLHPRLHRVITGEVAKFNNVQMSEVRALKTPVQAILHHYLGSLLWAGQTRIITSDTLIHRVWHQHPDDLSRTCRANRRRMVHDALLFIAANTGGAWVCEPLSGDRYRVERLTLIDK